MIEVACATEGNYVPHSAAMLHSLLTRSGDLSIRIRYLHGPDFRSNDQKLLEAMVDGLGGSISFLTVPDNLCAGLPTTGFTGRATWYRIFLPELFPGSERILSLDLDLIIRHPLDELWLTELGDRYVGAVTNVLPRHYEQHIAAAGFDKNAYFNAGVMLLNLGLMRKDKCSETMRRYGTERRKSLVLRDQDALNAVLGANRLPLDPRWNCMNSFFLYPWSAEAFSPNALARAKADPAVRHFEGPGPNKPWHYLCESGSRELYWNHRRQTPWPRGRSEGRTPLNVVRKSLAKFRPSQ